jgi:hypothetical protein
MERISPPLTAGQQKMLSTFKARAQYYTEGVQALEKINTHTFYLLEYTSGYTHIFPVKVLCKIKRFNQESIRVEVIAATNNYVAESFSADRFNKARIVDLKDFVLYTDFDYKTKKFFTLIEKATQ